MCFEDFSDVNELVLSTGHRGAKHTQAWLGEVQLGAKPGSNLDV